MLRQTLPRLMIAVLMILAGFPAVAAHSDPENSNDNTLTNFRELSRVYRTVTILGDGSKPSYTGPGVVVRYQSRTEASCGVIYVAGNPYTGLFSGGDRYVLGDSQVDVGAGCSSGISWTPKLYIFLSPPGNYYFRASGPSEFTPPGQDDFGYVSKYCNLGSSSNTWRHQINSGAAKQDRTLSCNAS